MNRLLSIALALGTIAVVPGVALGDQRIDLHASGEFVISGATARFTPFHSVSESQDWSLLKYEVEKLSSGSFSFTAVTRQESQQNHCPGFEETVDSTYRTCSVTTSQSLVVLEAGVATSDSAQVQQAFLSITAVTATTEVFGVRSWLDVDDDGVRDAFEPASQQKTLSVAPATALRDLLSFEFEPPNSDSRTARAWVLPGIISASAVDVERLSFRVFESNPLGRQQASGSFRYNSHPQIGAYELEALDLTLRLPGIILAEVWYEESVGKNVLVASHRFDYSDIGIGSVITALSSSDPGAVSFSNRSGRGIIQPASAGEATYSLSAKTSSGTPLINQEVFFFIDVFDLPEAASLKVDGGDLFPAGRVRDRAVLSKLTDSAGRIEFNISTSQATSLGEIKIGYSINGITAGSWGTNSSDQHLIWTEGVPKLTAKSTPQGEGSLGQNLDLYFSVQAPAGKDLEGGYQMILLTEYPLYAENPSLGKTYSGMTQGNGQVGLSRQASGSGSTLVTVQLIHSSGKVSEAYWRVDWDSKGFKLSAKALSTKPAPGIEFTSLELPSKGGVAKFNGRLLNEFGKPVTRADLDSRVRFKFYVGGVKSGESFVTLDSKGQFSISTSNRAKDLAATAELIVGGKVLAMATCAQICASELGYPAMSAYQATWVANQGDGTVKMYAKNIVGAGKVQFYLNDKEIAWVNAADADDAKLLTVRGSAYLVRTVNLVEGKNVLVIMVDGEQTRRVVYNYAG